ncbi:aldehyde dehydrogenase family protein [Allorhizocola rhizosphaerae]|uniref:aldehyde dehydrogenase family protein n=1 Tax=Allorhizocola rhizosphaerae TaxID=1872709 RepID=UPI000E3B6C2C|nr:aldehyde dehydrogenase family protein [Allorhizocola rhizosphaerae]
MYEVEHLIGGQWHAGPAADAIEVLNPATDALVTRAPIASADEIDAAVAGAKVAAEGWARTPAAQRSQVLRAAADALDAQAGELAALTNAEMGRPHAQALEGVRAGVATLRQYAELGAVHRGRSLAGSAIDMMVYEPRGVVAAITPWNDPVAVSCGLLGAALVTGNTVVYKPSERTPGTGWMLAQVLAKQLPDGVLSMVCGDGAVGARLASGEVDVVTHVGSSETGRAITMSARRGTKVLLENGGNDPLVVDGDVDPRWAAAQAALGAFANAGQICVSVERIYVHRDIAEPFLRALVEEARKVQLGPLVDRAHREKVHGHVADSKARVLCGGEIPTGPGAFYPATVLAGCTDDMQVMCEETFGPVAPVAVVGSFSEGLGRAQNSPYGLAATVLTGSMQHAQSAIAELSAGTVKINNVFGGAPGGAAHPRGISGQGFGYGPELMDEMTFVKVVHLEPPPQA